MPETGVAELLFVPVGKVPEQLSLPEGFHFYHATVQTISGLRRDSFISNELVVESRVRITGWPAKPDNPSPNRLLVRKIKNLETGQHYHFHTGAEMERKLGQIFDQGT